MSDEIKFLDEPVPGRNSQRKPLYDDLFTGLTANPGKTAQVPVSLFKNAYAGASQLRQASKARGIRVVVGIRGDYIYVRLVG